MRRVKLSQSGFTLFEVLIYIALFTFIMGGAILSSYQIFEGSAQVQALAEREVELNFVLRKIDWALNGATSVFVLNSGTTLQVLRDGGKTYEFTEADGTITLEHVGTDEYILTSSRLKIEDLSFAVVGGNPQQLEIRMTVDGDAVGPITRFIR